MHWQNSTNCPAKGLTYNLKIDSMLTLDRTLHLFNVSEYFSINGLLLIKCVILTNYNNHLKRNVSWTQGVFQRSNSPYVHTQLWRLCVCTSLQQLFCFCFSQRTVVCNLKLGLRFHRLKWVCSEGEKSDRDCWEIQANSLQR